MSTSGDWLRSDFPGEWRRGRCLRVLGRLPLWFREHCRPDLQVLTERKQRDFRHSRTGIPIERWSSLYKKRRRGLVSRDRIETDS